eukprot:g6159.t1
MDAVLGLVRRPCVDRADGGDRSTPASHLDALEAPLFYQRRWASGSLSARKGGAIRLGETRSLEQGLVHAMGCSSSRHPTLQPAFKPARMDGGHNFDFAAALNIVEENEDNELKDPVSSWDMQGIPAGYPAEKLLPPDRKLHEKHVRKLRKFLKEVETTPDDLEEKVSEKRSRSGRDETRDGEKKQKSGNKKSKEHDDAESPD